jgi:hypothetical protein
MTFAQCTGVIVVLVMSPAPMAHPSFVTTTATASTQMPNGIMSAPGGKEHARKDHHDKRRSN